MKKRTDEQVQFEDQDFSIVIDTKRDQWPIAE